MSTFSTSMSTFLLQLICKCPFFNSLLLPNNKLFKRNIPSIIGGDEKSYRLKFDSPFEKENLSIYLYDLDMRYVNREKNIDILCRIINKFINEETGNYMAFMPSFQYLKLIKQHLLTD